MNSERRGQIEKIIASLESSGEDLVRHRPEYLSWGKMLESLTEQLENVRDEELESLQSMPIGIQKGSRGEVVKERLRYLNIALATVEALEAESVDEDQIPDVVGNITRVLENAMA